MRRPAIAILVMFLTYAAANAQTFFRSTNYAHTYSIVAYDPEGGQMGVAVQSHYFNVGSIVSWAEPGVGVVATQSLVDVSYGPLGLELMRAGKSAEQSLRGLVSSDENPEVRQVAMVDVNGVVAVHTGKNCIAEAGHYKGEHYSVQANLMLKNTVWEAMSQAYEKTRGELAERLLAALDAAQKEGGDIRGKQSAALIVVSVNPVGNPYLDRPYDLRVDDSTEPLKELRRLVGVARAYNHVSRGDDYVTEGDFSAALVEYQRGMELQPDNVELRFWYAATLVSVGKVEDSLPVFKSVFSEEPVWRELVPRLVDSGILPDDRKAIDRIMKQGR